MARHSLVLCVIVLVVLLPITLTAQTTTKVLVMNVQYAGAPGPLYVSADIEAAFDNAAPHWNDYSYGKDTLDYDVVVVPVPKTALEYRAARNKLGVLLRDALVSVGPTVLAQYNMHALMHDLTSGNNGFPGMKAAYSNVPGFGVLVQELGHGFNMAHSNGWEAGDFIVGEPGAGAPVERGYLFCVMAKANYQTDTNFNPRVKQHLGWLQAPETLDVTQSGLVRIQASDSATLAGSVPAALRIRGNADWNYWIEYRANIANPNVLDGALVFWGSNDWKYRNQQEDTDQQSLLLDMKPNTAAGLDDFLDSPLEVGTSWTTPEGILLETVQTNPFGSPPDLYIYIGLPPAHETTIDIPNVVDLTSPAGTTTILPGAEPFTFEAVANDPNAPGGIDGIERVEFDFYDFDGGETPFRTHVDTSKPFTCTVGFLSPTEWPTLKQNQGYLVVARARSEDAYGGHWNEEGTFFMINYP